MVLLNQAHASKLPVEFVFELMKFFAANIDTFVDMQTNKQKYALLMGN